MLNVNELTSRLAKMSDPQLQQYARIHKDDPYTLALAAAESKRRSQLRAGGQQQAAQQPTVADQTLAQMGAPAPMPQQMQQPQQMQPQPQLPEDQGIGMLPAQNMAGMADGGIAGYADGGMVAFADGDLVRTPEFDLRSGTPTVYGTNTTDVFAPVAVEETSSPAGRFFSGLFAGPEGARERYAAQQNKLARERALLDRLGQLEGLGFKQQTRAQQNEAANVRKELDNLRSTRVAETKPAAAPTTAPKPSAESPKTFESKLTAPPDGTKPGAGRARTLGTGTAKDDKAGTTTAPDFVPSKPGNLTEQFNIMKGLMPSGAEYDTLAAETEAGFAKRATEREKNRPKEKAYTGLEALLGKEEEKAKGKEARNLNMALINAGLAIAGGKSQYALQNIAEGAQVGTKQYQEGLEKLEAAAIERRKQAAMIEEARRAEARGDWKDAEAFNQQAFEAGIGIKRSKIEGMAKITGDSLKAATDRVNTQEQIYSQDQRALMQEKGLNTRAREQNISAERVAGIYANSRLGGGAGLRGQITDDDIYKAYNQNELKDTFGDFKKQFPDFASYRNYILQQMKQGSAPADATGGIKFLGFEK
jgi:hypothetical protein